MGGKRFKETRKLNKKKVAMVIIVPILIILLVFGILYLVRNARKYNVKRMGTKGYYTIYENGKWGVINSTGEKVIDSTYDEMIVIPDHSKATFIVTENVNYKEETFESKIINESGTNMSTTYELVKPIEYNVSDMVYDTNLLIAKKGDKYGLIDFQGEEKFEPVYDEIITIDGIKNKVKVKEDGKWGLINTETNNFVAPAIYEDVAPIYKGEGTSYIVSNEDRKGVRSDLGKEVLKTEYSEIKPVESKDFVVAKKGDVTKIYDMEGTEQKALTKEVKKVSPEKQIVYEENGKYGLMNINDKILLNPEYDDIIFAGGYNFIVKKDNKYNVVKVDKEGNNTAEENGKSILEQDYESIIYDKKASMYIAKNGEKEDIYDSELQKKLSDVMFLLSDENSITVSQGGEEKIYNFKFEEISEKDAYPNNNLIRFTEKSKYGLKDREGRVIVSPIYDDCKIQNKYGYVAVSRDGKWGCLNYNGDVLVEPKYDFNDYLLIDFIGEYFRDKNAELEVYTKEYDK